MRLCWTLHILHIYVSQTCVTSNPGFVQDGNMLDSMLRFHAVEGLPLMGRLDYSRW